MSSKKLLNKNERVNVYKRKIHSKLIEQTKTNETKVAKMEVTDDTRFVKFELERTSTPNFENICEHCMHQHAKECCMYVYDDHSDVKKYSLFKHSIDEPYYTSDSSEDFDFKIGSTTPNHFPNFTETNPNFVSLKMYETVQKQQIVFLRQYFWPVYMPPSFYPPIHNPFNMNFVPPTFWNGNYFQQLPPYMPCVMRQIPISVQPHHNNFQSQIIESHSYVPMNYVGNRKG